MAELVVVRHGETVWSREGRHTGRSDVPLTATGQRQAAAVGHALHGRTFALVLTSPLVRARRTAKIAGFGHAETDPDLAEWDYGGYEGMTSAQIRAQVGGDWTVFAEGVRPGATPGESLAEVAARADRVISRVLVALVTGDVVAFSHGHLLRVLAARWIDQKPAFGARLALDTATIGRLGVEHDLRVVREWNRTPA